MKEFTNSKLPSSSKTRWNFGSRVVCTVKENYESILECLIKIDESEGSTVLEPSTLFHYLKADSFVFYLELYNSIFVHVSILFNQLQSKQSEKSKVKEFIINFKTQLGIIKTRYEESEKTESEINDVQEIIHNIVEDITSRLEFEGHLIAESLFDATRYDEFTKHFPSKTLKIVLEAYPFLDRVQLQTEMEVIYSRQEFRGFSNLTDIFHYIKITNLIEDFPEVYNLLQILLTIPMTTADSDRRLSTLKRIKSDTRSRMGDGRLNA